MPALPEDLKRNILSQPLYRQKDLRRLIPASPSAFEHGRLGQGALAGLKFTRLGRMIVYKASDVVEFLESLPSFENTTAADQAKAHSSAAA